VYELKIGSRTIAITHGENILFPRAKISKNELIDYYLNIADFLIPHMKNRPISMQRFVDGIDHPGFYQKNAGDYFPRWIKTVPIAKKDDGNVKYVVCNDVATLVYLANQLSITFHLWLSRIDKLNFPDRMIFDLDPSVKGFAPVRTAARQLRNLLEDELGLIAFLMTTGSRGVHVVVPLDRKKDFDFVRMFARDVAQVLVARFPKTLTIEVRKIKRGKRVFIDYLRNAFGQTGVAPYCVRAKRGAPVATPIEWKELGRVTPHKFTIKNIFKRLSKKDDPWRNINKQACSLKRARMTLDKLLEKSEGKK